MKLILYCFYSTSLLRKDVINSYALLGRSCYRVISLLVAAVLVMPVYAQNNVCSVRADSLASARSIYDQQCSFVQRRDCDAINGVWYCSSETIDESIPAGLVNNSSTESSQSQSSGSSSNQLACLDPDGDGWGWNGNTCRVGAVPTVNQSTSVQTSSGASSSSSNSGSATCVDPDGDGWGWNGASCRVGGTQQSNAAAANQTTSNSSSNAGVCPDPDGDGWGWLNGETCRVVSGNSSGGSSTATSSSGLSFRPSDITDLVLLTGQSNALGANTSFDATLDRPSDKVFAFTSTGWQRADLHQIWDRGWHPRNHPETDPSNNLLLHFGKRLVSRDSSRVVGFILVSAPGAPISNWDYGDDFYSSIQARVLDAINQLPHKSQLDGILWHQGETDAEDTAEYGFRLNALIQNFRTENWFSSRKSFICGEIAKRGGVNNRLNALNSDGDSATACVSSLGLETKIDNSHFTAEGLRGLGQRYADQFYSMTR